MQNDAAELKLGAERKAGALLAEMEKNRGGGDQRSDHRSHRVTSGPPKLAEMDGLGTHGGDRRSSDTVSLEKVGISRSQSSRWQVEAAVSEEWGTSVVVEHETIRAVVEAYAEGLIELPRPDPRATKSSIRYAPSFVIQDVEEGHLRHPYTAMSIALFIGWTTPGTKDRPLLPA